MEAAQASSHSIVFAVIIGVIIGLMINFIPTIIAFVKGNANKMQVLLLNIIPWGLSIVTSFLGVAIISIVIAIINIILWVVALVKAIRDY
jgi:uncharacterized membrane protein